MKIAVPSLEKPHTLLNLTSYSSHLIKWDYQNIEKIYLNMIFLAEKFNEFFRLIERNLKKNRKIIKLDIY